MCSSIQSTPRFIPAVSYKSTKRKINFSSTSLLISPEHPTSPILNTRRNKSKNSSINTETNSPILRSKYSTSPVISSKYRKQKSEKNCVRKLEYKSDAESSKKFKLFFNSEHIKEQNQNKPIFNENCVQKLDYESDAESSKKFKLFFNSEHIKEPKQNKPIFNENFSIKKRKKSNKNTSFRARKYDETIEIESVYSQPQSPHHVIEIVNSQEIRKPSEKFATRFQHRHDDEIIEEMSQNSYTPPEDKIIIEDISQTSSFVSNISNCTVVADSFEKSSDEYIWSPIKKKKYKPGTFSHKFQRILRKQKAQTAIWRHELYLVKSTNYKLPFDDLDLKETIVEICKIITDYGMNTLECVEVNTKEKCLVIADLSDLIVMRKDLIKIFPPFCIKYLKIDKCDVKAYVNVHRIIKCN